MTVPGVQVNVRLTAAEIELLDALRRAAGSGVSRAELLRSLLREKRRVALDARIAAAYDAAAADDGGLGEASAALAGETLRGL